jgi:hypothetical protein
MSGSVAGALAASPADLARQAENVQLEQGCDG